jgi:Fanconi anemia group I protein
MASSEQAAKQLHVLFGDLDKSRSVEMPRRLLFLTEITADLFLPRFLHRLEVSLDLAGQLIVWLRAVADSGGSGLDLAPREAAVCALLAHLVNVSTELVNTALPVGPAASDLVLKFLGRLYLTIGNLAKYFFLRSRQSTHVTAAQAARFDRLVAKVSEQLSPYVYGLINYIESRHKEAEADAAAGARTKRKKDPNAAKAKVLKDTKEIPTLIFHIETYDKNIIKLGKRIKLKFNVKVATVRDFR